MVVLKGKVKYYTALCTKLNSWQTFSTLSCKLKLTEVPEVCTREDWSTTIKECRTALQKYPVNPQFLKHKTRLVPTETVVKRIQDVSYRSSYLSNTFRQLLANSEDNVNELRWPGLVTLMLSKSVGNPFRADDFVSKSLEDLIWTSQVTLAEIINLLYCNFIFRKESARLASTEKVTGIIKVHDEINRLVYSYFMSVVLHKASTIGNYKMLMLLGDILESLAKKKTSQDASNLIHYNLHHWEYDAFHSQGLLLATGCQAALELAGYDDHTQQMAFNFGQQFAFAMKAHAEIQHYWNYLNSISSTLNMSSFPIALHLQNHPETLFFVYNCKDSLNNIDACKLNEILQSNSAIEDAKVQLEFYTQNATELLQYLNKSENNEVMHHLINLINTLNNANQWK